MRPFRVAIIDCGTNTFNLLVADRINGKWKFLCRRKRAVKLKSAGHQDGTIGEQPAKRALQALTDYRLLTDALNVNRLRIVGTAALRDATNGKALLARIRSATGFQIKLIDGLEEAELIWKGVRQAVDLGEDVSLIMDIGGGSTEFILCNANKIFWKKSFGLGAARLKERFPFADPVRKAEVLRLEKFLSAELSTLQSACRKYHPVRLIGSSGSFDSFAAIIRRKKRQPPLRGTHYVFSINEYRALHRELLCSSYVERLKLPGLVRMRADMIVPASVLLNFVLSFTEIKKLALSTFALKEGLLEEFIA